MPSSTVLAGHDWLGLCRRSAAGLRELLAQAPTSRERVTETGVVGEGGDRTLVIDQAAEDVVFAELRARCTTTGARFTAVSEERGIVDFGDPGVLVVIDPIDGSLNAKRGLAHHALSIAVADGPTMADVRLGYVYDVGTARGVARGARRGRVARRRAARRAAGRAPHAGRTPGGRGDRVGGAAPAGRGRAGAARLRPPRARDRVDRDLALPGRRRPRRRDGLARALPVGRRRRGAAHRARGRRPWSRSRRSPTRSARRSPT